MEKNKNYFVPMLLAVTIGFCSIAYGNQQPDTENFMQDGKNYITNTYTIENDENIDELLRRSFEEDGYTYHQIDISSEPVVEILTKEVEETEKITVSSEDDAAVLAQLGATKEYTDEDGFSGILELKLDKIRYTVNGYSTKSYTKTDQKMYYGLSSMDTSQIAKSIWSGGVQLSLNDVQWIGDNNSASAETAVGNNYNAKAYYSGTYSVKVPTSYTAEAVFGGTVEKEVSDRTKYKVTYLGEKTELPLPEEADGISKPLLAGFIVLDALLLGIGIYLFRKFQRKHNKERDDFEAKLDENIFTEEEDHEEI